MLVSILYKLKLYYNLKCYFESMYIFHIHIFKITIISTYFSPFLLKMYIFKIRVIDIRLIKATSQKLDISIYMARIKVHVPLKERHLAK